MPIPGATRGSRQLRQRLEHDLSLAWIGQRRRSGELDPGRNGQRLADPEALRDQVTSPGGTTLAGLQAMEKGGFRSVILETVLAAKKRSEELSGK